MRAGTEPNRRLVTPLFPTWTECPVKGGYNAVVPAIPEICTYGDTLEEARGMAQDAIQCYLESALETGGSIPGDIQELTTERVEVAIP